MSATETIDKAGEGAAAAPAPVIAEPEASPVNMSEERAAPVVMYGDRDSAQQPPPVNEEEFCLLWLVTLIDVFLNHNTVRATLQFLYVCCAIFCIHLVSTTTSAFPIYMSDFNKVVRNWGKRPITEVYATTTGQCDRGGDKIEVPKFGSASTACACSTDPTKTSSDARCDSSKKEEGCLSQESVDKFRLTWRSRTLCVVREGEAQKDRPIPSASSDGDCGVGYQKCGSGDYKEGRSICWPCDDDGTCPVCPLTALEVSTAAPTSGYSEATDATLSDGHKLYYMRGDDSSSPSAFPFVDVVFSFYDIGLESGICFPYDLSHRTDQDNYHGNSDSYSYKSYHGSACRNRQNPRAVHEDQDYFSWDRQSTVKGKVDKRYELLDSMPESSFLLENFLGHEWCTECTDQCGDYLASGGQQCAADPSTSTDCVMNRAVARANRKASKMDDDEESATMAWGGCFDADDNEVGGLLGIDVCERIMFQSKCGALKRFASEAEADFRGGIFGQREIFWKPSCPTTIEDLSNTSDFPHILLLWCIPLVMVYILWGVICPFCFFLKIVVVDIQLFCTITRDYRDPNNPEPEGEVVSSSQGVSPRRSRPFIPTLRMSSRLSSQSLPVLAEAVDPENALPDDIEDSMLATASEADHVVESLAQGAAREPGTASRRFAEATAEVAAESPDGGIAAGSDVENTDVSNQEPASASAANDDAAEGTIPTGAGANARAPVVQRTTVTQRCCACLGQCKRSFYWIQGWKDEEYGSEFLPFFFTPDYEIYEKIYYEKFFATFGVLLQCWLCLEVYGEVRKMENLFQNSTHCTEGFSKQAMVAMAESITGLKFSLESIFIFAGCNLIWTFAVFYKMFVDKEDAKTKEDFIEHLWALFLYFFFWCPWCQRARVSVNPENIIHRQEEAPTVAFTQAVDADYRGGGVAAHQVQTEVQRQVPEDARTRELGPSSAPSVASGIGV